MHGFFASLHIPMSLGVALLVGLYGVKLTVGYIALARLRQWWAKRSATRR
jgi:hypothetical protein